MKFLLLAFLVVAVLSSGFHRGWCWRSEEAHERSWAAREDARQEARERARERAREWREDWRAERHDAQERRDRIRDQIRDDIRAFRHTWDDGN